MLARVVIESIRNITHCEIELDHKSRFYGANSSGKTSFIEALYLLGHGRSFKTPHIRDVIQHGSAKLTLFGQLQEGGSKSVGLERGRDGAVTIRIDRTTQKSVAELTRALPQQLITPASHALIEGSPAMRRRYLDWGVFHVELGYASLWRRYKQLLRQRNASLRARESESLDRNWRSLLAAAGEEMAKQRALYLGVLQPVMSRLCREMLPEIDVELSSYQGWPEGESLPELIDSGVKRDREQGTTRQGPHRADLRVRVGGEAAVRVLSRGQQKLLVATLLIAQVELLNQHAGPKCLILIDDLAAELDSEHQGRFLAKLSELPNQVVLTTISDDLEASGSWAKFHVKQGQISAID